MIRVNDDWVVDVDTFNYILKRDMHKMVRGKKKEDPDVPLYTIKGYFPSTGKWERHYSRPNVYADLYWHCSECGYKNDDQYANVYHKFCPNCGAKMEGEVNERLDSMQ